IVTGGGGSDVSVGKIGPLNPVELQALRKARMTTMFNQRRNFMLCLSTRYNVGRACCEAPRWGSPTWRVATFHHSRSSLKLGTHIPKVFHNLEKILYWAGCPSFSSRE